MEFISEASLQSNTEYQAEKRPFVTMETALLKHLHSLDVPKHTTLFALIKSCGTMGNVYLVFVPTSLQRALKSPEIS